MKPNYRRCVSCGLASPKKSLWRIVRIYPSHEIQLDRGQGRSAYLCPKEECLQKARLKKRLSRSLRAEIPESIYQILDKRSLGEC